jgi:hypothetical protein
MKRSSLALLLTCSLLAHARGAALDTNLIERATGLKGTWNEAEGVFKVSAPRNDVEVAVEGWTMPAFMGLTSWVAFTDGKKEQAMIAGDLVLFQDEVNPVLRALLDHGLAVTALHNHFFFDHPKVYFLHVGGEGTTEKLATGVRSALDTVKQLRAANPQPQSTFGAAPLPVQSSITAAAIEKIFGVKGQTNNGMLKIVIGRKTKMPCGCDMTKDMGVNTWAAFAGTDDNAIVDGDFAVLEEELQPVLKALTREGVNIVAIHSHMTQENPRILFLHYWGRGHASDLARAVKTALGQTKT